MKQGLSKGWMAVLIVAVVLIADQVIKILVKTNMYYGEDIRIADWFYLRFVENPGMAFLLCWCVRIINAGMWLPLL